MARSTGKVRAARFTDLAALGELSRLAQADGDGTRSLGLPVTGQRIGIFSLFRLPLGAFSPNDVIYVFDRDGHVAGLLRAERDSPRDEWTVVELDAVGDMDAGDVRFRLVQHLLRDGGKRGAVRFHVACGDVDDNVELFMQAGFIRFGDEHVLFREPEDPLPAPLPEDEARAARIRPAAALDAVPLSRLYASVTPAPVQRLEAVRIHDWERQGRDWRVPRSSLAPILRFADVDAFVQESEGGGKDGTQLDAFAQVGVAKEDQPHYLKVMARPETSAETIIRYALGVIAARSDGSTLHRQGVLAPVRTYEAPIDRRLEEEGFASIATVTLLMKETLVRVAEPRLVPAGVR
ncbi:MAG TPA: hypothetical protein VLK59_03470 [Solirubrobacteraceae bacterium]|nr:hypothetical protein [Solirubrobacteraceae bacterium]